MVDLGRAPTFGDSMLSPKDREKIAEYKDRYRLATTKEEKDFFHKQAELIRKEYQYSGGADGSEYRPLTERINTNPSGRGNNATTTVQEMAIAPSSLTPLSDEFFVNTPTGVSQIQNGLTGLNVDKLVAVGVGFMFLSMVNSFISRKRR